MSEVVSCLFWSKSVHVHDGDQLYRRTFFFKTELIKKKLRGRMGQHRLNRISLMCMENDILKTIDFKPITKQFSAKKCCKCLL